MDSTIQSSDSCVASFLSLQQAVTQYYKDEARLSGLFLEEVFRLTGAECLLLRKETDGISRLTGARIFEESLCTSEEIMKKLEDYIKGNPIQYSDDEKTSYFIDCEPALILCSDQKPFTRLVRVGSSPFLKDLREVFILSRNEIGKGKDLIPLIRGLINLVSQAGEKARLEDKIHSSERSIAKALDSKTQFLGSLSHEIRSPLNGIICMGSLLRETELDEEQLDLLNIIQFSADNITRIIQDLVDLTLLTSGRVILKNETFSLSTLCRNLIKNMEEDADRKGLKLGVHIEEGTDAFHGDSVRIGQILSNLLQNAIKYTEAGDIYLGIRRRPGEVEFVVSDTGVGIPLDKQDLIFEEFTQLGNSVRKDKIRGVGLGLAIVKDLVEIMGGAVSVKSREGKGSSFLVVLPDQDVAEENKVNNPDGEAPLARPGNARLLVVDDDEINRLYLKTVLEGIGARIDEAENGQIAVEKVAGNKYDMVLMDISMPVMNGLDATREIRKFQKDLPVLAVTANAFDEDIQRILESGLDDVVLKPVDEEQLMNKISNWLGRSRENG